MHTRPVFKRIARWLSVALLLALFAAGGMAQDKGKKFIGNRDSMKYHTATCGIGAKMSPKNRIEFDSREAAEKAGYVACKVCMKSKKKTA